MAYGLVTVFGGTGFLGRRIVERLGAAGARVRVAVRRTMEGVPPQGGDVEVVYADVRDGTTIAQAVRDSDAVVNAVGLYVEQGEATFQAVHVHGAQEVARVAREAGIPRLVHISGIGADVNSESSYVRSRGLGELAVREACTEATILRPSVLFGRGDALFRSLAAITRISPVFPLFGNGSTRLQPVFVGDVAEAVVKAVGSPSESGKVYELGGPRVYRYKELVELVLVHLKRRRVLVPVPFFVWEIQATLLGILPNPPLTRDQVILMRGDNVVSDTALTFADLSITPRRVEAELPSIMAYCSGKTI
ncbi:MAG: complex I NDUFA9 subunit family protein [Pseudomonadota bacterium]|nr:complex I NDUFA9 subunit family protein [Pseudomonadota bacterium]